MKFFVGLCLAIVSLASAKNPSPHLVIFLSIDQMRPDYFEKHGKYFTGGLHRLYTQGIVYSNADLNYATSETGPGHATLGTGCYPAKNGILGNDWIDPHSRQNVYCVEDSTALPVEGSGGGFSARNLELPAIGDWLKKHSPQSRVVSISAKDRGAILMAGFSADAVFWYEKKNGTMVTSDYYMKKIPSWAAAFNASGWIEKNVPESWNKMLPEDAYAGIGPDQFRAEQLWDSSTTFPHKFHPGKKPSQILGTPYGDLFMIDFALAALRGETLGQRGTVDLLNISLSNCDYTGHGFGPDSHEMLDFLVRLDRGLGRFFDEVDRIVGAGNYVVALSADHAVCPLPEFNADFRNISAKRYNYTADIKPKLDSLSSILKYELDTSEDIFIKNTFINYPLTKSGRWDTLRLQKEISRGLKSIDAFVEVYFRHEMMSTAPSDKLYMQKYRNSYYAPRGEDFRYRIREYCILSSGLTGTTHGSPYEYDTHIPLIFWWKGISPQRISRRVHSADAAPTLAKIAGFPFPDNLDGVPLIEALP